MALENANAVVIKLQDYSESSQIATFLTDRMGKVALIAKGSKRAKSSTGGALDMLTLNEIVFTPSNSGGLGTLREARTIEQYAAVRATTDRYYAALYVAELAGLFQEGAEEGAFFELLTSTLKALCDPRVSVSNTLDFFESHVLETAGLAPNLQTCARCGAAIQPTPDARVSLQDGGVLCSRCPGGVPIGRGSLAALRRVIASTVTSVQRLKLTGDIQSDVSGLLASFIVYNAARQPRLMRHVRPDFARHWRKWSRTQGGPRRLDGN